MKYFFLLLLPSICFAQIEYSVQTDGHARFANTNTFQLRYKTEDKGNRYLYDSWKEGYYILNDTVLYSHKKMQIDLEKGLLVIGNDDGTAILIRDKNVTDFAINTKDNLGKHYYTRVPASAFEDTNRTSHFYEINSNLNETNFLLKEQEKYLFDPNLSKGYQTQNNLPKEWKVRTNYYVKNKNGIYVKSKLNKKQLLEVMDDKSSELKSYTKSKKLSFSDEDDVVKILAYYHSL